MNVLLMTIGAFQNISENGIYTDLLRYFRNMGHSVYIACSRERRLGLPTCVEKNDGIKVLRVQVGNITKVNFIEKGLSTLMIEYQYEQAIRKYFADVTFDIILYSTPPITLAGIVGRLKKRDNSFTYLMLKDIFPAGAVDLGILRDKGAICKYFRFVEKCLYKNSDFIGCMSPQNIRYLLEENPQIDRNKVGLCPNTIDIIEKTNVNKNVLCNRYGLPKDKLLLVYGGNFGRPQNVDYIVKIIEASKKFDNVHFIMCGSGTDFYKIREYKQSGRKENITIIDALPYKEYTELLSICDVGMLFLDYRFYVPNFPSRLLDYLNYELPVIAATDINTDIKDAIIEGDFGWWCESREEENFIIMLEKIVKEWKEDRVQFVQKGINAKNYLKQYFRTEIAYNAIINSYNRWKESVEEQDDRSSIN